MGHGASVTRRHNLLTSENDNLSAAFADLVPERYKDTNQFLNVVQWNVEWFGAAKSTEKDKSRYGLVLRILEALNADLFVFQEVAGPSRDRRYPGSLDGIAEELTKRGAGDYVVFYTDAGGEQRVAMMWDRKWLRAKGDVTDLFERGTHKAPDGKDAFAGRTPLYGYFSARIAEPGEDFGTDKFDFQALGVHLKAMAEGHEQRLASAKTLADWLSKDAPMTDSDALIVGDWNASPDDSCWAPIHKLEKGPNSGVFFQSINDPSDFSYLWLKNRSDKFVSRIDLAAMTLSSMEQVKGQAARVVRWKPIEETIARAGKLTAREVVKVMREIKEAISDHMPTVTQFYITK